MKTFMPEIHVDARDRQLDQHGNYGFPVACYQGDLQKNTVAWHWHDELELILIVEGRITIGFGTSSEIISSGDACFLNAGVLHAAWRSDHQPCLYHSIVFHPRLIGSADSIFWAKYIQPLFEPGFPQMVRFRKDQSTEKGIITLLDRAWHITVNEQNAYEVETRYSLTQIVSYLASLSAGEPQHLSRKASRDMERMKCMLAWLDDHFSEDISVRQIAGSCGISESECLRCFKRTLDCSPVQYLVSYRLRRASLILAGSEESISDVAFACGFLDMSYFSKLFRERYGMTPTEFRRRESINK